MDAPRITVYARVLDTVYDTELEGYVNVRDKTGAFNFGRISSTTGGESSRVVEFDIWNNEPALSAGMWADSNEDAVNCRFTAWDDATCTTTDNITIIDISSPSGKTYFTRARSVTDDDYNKDFQPIGGIQSLPRDQMSGNVSMSPGILSGVAGGDHMKIQTKIILTPDSEPGLKTFVLAFMFDYE